MEAGVVHRKVSLYAVKLSTFNDFILETDEEHEKKCLQLTSSNS